MQLEHVAADVDTLEANIGIPDFLCLTVQVIVHPSFTLKVDFDTILPCPELLDPVAFTSPVGQQHSPRST